MNKSPDQQNQDASGILFFLGPELGRQKHPPGQPGTPASSYLQLRLNFFNSGLGYSICNLKGTLYREKI